MEILIIVIFVLGYLGIAFEHSIHVDKAASALLIGMLCWGLYALNPASFLQVDEYKSITELVEEGHHNHEELAPQTQNTLHFFEEQIFKNSLEKNPEVIEQSHTHEYVKHYVEHGLSHHLFEIAGILFFLLGAMTIVELVDAHDGFSVITDRITTTNTVKLLWIVGFITFFFSAALDNLTTSIVMISVLRKLIADQKTRWYFAGFVIIAANAGGAWSPIGDVTTTMLWIGKQMPDTINIISTIFLPSLVTLVVPLTIATFVFKGEIKRPEMVQASAHHNVVLTSGEKTFFFVIGLMGLMFVPVFKTITHLPPFMGMMLSLGVIWGITELVHKKRPIEEKSALSPLRVLQKIDTASVLFFLGILLAVAALQEVGHLALMAGFLDDSFGGNIYAINIAIGFLSAIVDNVPLVAAAQGMYEIAAEGVFASNGTFWKFLAYCAGTGGSSLIIGSAAGVAVMGLEKIPFGWYFAKISLLAVVGYLAGAGVFMLMF